jgi:ABC-type branched-subunit amino acid transport system ATPase component
LQFSDRIYVIDFGRLISSGTPAVVRRTEGDQRGIWGWPNERHDLSIKDLKVNYGGIEAVKGISFDVPKGDIVTLIGANGAGKSSTCAPSRLVKLKSGSIEFEARASRARTPPQSSPRHYARSGRAPYLSRPDGLRKPPRRRVYAKR